MKTGDQHSGHRNPKGRRPKGLTITIATMGTAVLAACATPAPLPPPPPPPPAPVVKAVPTRPLPPGGASYVMTIPGKDNFGRRQTVNLDLTDDERVWHFRSAWNVAALNCTAPQFQPILDAYSAYIKDHARTLKAVNDRIDRKYRQEMGARRAGIIKRETVMTGVYNYFALPPARRDFCAAALDISNRALAAPPSDPIAFANANFALLEAPFENFFNSYENYQQMSASWDAEYGAQYGPSQPGWVAVQEACARGEIVPTAGVSDPADTLAAENRMGETFVDDGSGNQVPVVPTNTQFVSQPVVEPVAADPDE